MVNDPRWKPPRKKDASFFSEVCSSDIDRAELSTKRLKDLLGDEEKQKKFLMDLKNFQKHLSKMENKK